MMPRARFYVRPATNPKVPSDIVVEGAENGAGVRMAIQRKREARKSVRQAGWVTLDGGFAARACEVIDLSATGAKIVIDDPSALSTRIRLAFSRDGRAGRPCEIVWRRGKSVGLRFTT